MVYNSVELLTKIVLLTMMQRIECKAQDFHLKENIWEADISLVPAEKVISCTRRGGGGEHILWGIMDRTCCLVENRTQE